MLSETRHFGGPDVVGVLAGHGVGGVVYFLADVEELLQIAGVAAFGVFLALADVAALPGQLRLLVALLHVVGEGKEALYVGVELLGLRGGQAVVFEGHEADALVGVAKLLHETGFAVGVAGAKIGEVKRGDFFQQGGVHNGKSICF